MGERIKTANGISRYFITERIGRDEKEYEISRELFVYLHNQFEYFADIESKLDCLMEYGVDNWCGYGDAMSEYYRRKRNE